MRNSFAIGAHRDGGGLALLARGIAEDSSKIERRGSLLWASSRALAGSPGSQSRYVSSLERRSEKEIDR